MGVAFGCKELKRRKKKLKKKTSDYIAIKKIQKLLFFRHGLIKDQLHLLIIILTFPFSVQALASPHGGEVTAGGLGAQLTVHSTSSSCSPNHQAAECLVTRFTHAWVRALPIPELMSVVKWVGSPGLTWTNESPLLSPEPRVK